MSGYEGEPDHTWDEYDWERFLQQQDHKTEKYMELLEKYLDDPQRDQIIAREMGWTQSLGQNDWSDEVDALMSEESGESEQSDGRSGSERGIEHRRVSRITGFIGPRSPSRFGSTSFSMTTVRCKISRRQ